MNKIFQVTKATKKRVKQRERERERERETCLLPRDERFELRA